MSLEEASRMTSFLVYKNKIKSDPGNCMGNPFPNSVWTC